MASIEGNTDGTGSGNGIGVFRLQTRNLADEAILGFVDSSGLIE
jgi:hypothetical protein